MSTNKTLGFTGSSTQLTCEQRVWLAEYLRHWSASQIGRDALHHGDCVVADEFVHYLALAARVLVIIHPPIRPHKRAYCLGAYEVKEPQDYLVRNRAIVDCSTRLLAAPGTEREVQRSGTWSTIRYALKKGLPVDIILPSGARQYLGERDEGRLLPNHGSGP